MNQLKNHLKINSDVTLYNKMTAPYNCKKCLKSCYTVPNCLSCSVENGFIEDSIYASNNDIKKNDYQ